MLANKSVDKIIYDLSKECKEAVYSNVNHRDILRAISIKLENLAGNIQKEHAIAMLESSQAD